MNPYFQYVKCVIAHHDCDRSVEPSAACNRDPDVLRL